MCCRLTGFIWWGGIHVGYRKTSLFDRILRCCLEVSVQACVHVGTWYFIENNILWNLYDDEVMELFYMCLRKDLNGMVQRVSFKRSFLVIFKYG